MVPLLKTRGALRKDVNIDEAVTQRTLSLCFHHTTAVHTSGVSKSYAYSWRTPMCRAPAPSSILSRIRRWFNPKKSRASVAQRNRKSTDKDWEELILEFEERSGGMDVVFPDKPILNPKQYEMLPYIECAYMTALTTVIWYLGRVFRLDAFLLLFYPLPTIYIASKYGLNFADWTMISVLFFVFIMVGPFFAVTYFFNTGLLAIAYSRALWWRFGWVAALLSGATAKALGLCLQLLFVSPILRYNAWKAVVEQVTFLLRNIIKVLGAAGINIVAPTTSTVQIAIVIVIVFHSVYHVFFTLLMSTLVLRRVEEDVKLARSPVKMPLVDALIRNAKSMKRRRH